MRYVTLFLLLFVVGCNPPYVKARGMIINHGTEKTVVKLSGRWGTKWRIDELSYTDVKLEDGRTVRIPTHIGQEGEQVILDSWACPEIVPKEGK